MSKINYRLYRAFRNKKALENMINKIDSHPVVRDFIDHLIQEEFKLIYENIELDFIETKFDEEKLCAYGNLSYYWPYKSGDIIEWQGYKIKYLDSLNLNEEIELQAQDGGLVYLYTGPRFLAYFELIEGELPDSFLQ